MTVLVQEKARKERLHGDKLIINREAAEAIFAGALVSINSAGKIVNAADTAGQLIVGVATKTAALGDSIPVETGIWEFSVSGVTVANIGATATVSDNDTVTLAATSTNDIAVGQIVDFVSGKAFVKIAFGS